MRGLKYMKNKDNSLVKVKNNIFTKIIKSIKSLFIKTEIKQEVIIQEESNALVDDFKQNLNMNTNISIIDLKNKYEQGKIGFNDMSDVEIDNLLLFYREEIEKKEEKLNNLKRNIEKIKNTVA